MLFLQKLEFDCRQDSKSILKGFCQHNVQQPWVFTGWISKWCCWEYLYPTFSFICRISGVENNNAILSATAVAPIYIQCTFSSMNPKTLVSSSSNWYSTKILYRYVDRNSPPPYPPPTHTHTHQQPPLSDPLFYIATFTEWPHPFLFW